MATIPAHENEFPEVLLSEGAAPAAPGTGLVVVYAKSDGLPYSKDDAGAESPMTPNAHIADTSDAHDASAISIADAGALYTATDVEAALAEVMGAVAGGGIPATIVDAKGDIIAATAADTVARLAAGTNGYALTAQSGQATGLLWAAQAPDCMESVITADVNLSALNTWTDSGLSLVLPAGAWLVEANIVIRTTQAGAEFIGIRLIESGGSSTVYANNGINLLSNNGQENNLTVRRRIAGGVTVKVQGLGELRTGVIEADGNDAALTDNVVSVMTAVRVTSI